jgi:thiol-disulfide isomerase/thioredoxin
MKKFSIPVFVLGGLLAALYAINANYNQPKAGEVLRPKNAIQEFKALDHAGKTVDLKAHRGKVLVINFWATYCPPCVAEMPAFINVQQKHQNKVQFVGISVDENMDEVNRFVKENGFKMNYPLVMASEAILQDFGDMPYLPTTVFVRKDGVIADQITGDLTEEKLEAILKKLL